MGSLLRFYTYYIIAYKASVNKYIQYDNNNNYITI